MLMSKIEQPSPARFYALLLIGIGLISLGIMLFLLLKDTPPAASAQDFSVVPASALLVIVCLWMIIWGKLSL